MKTPLVPFFLSGQLPEEAPCPGVLHVHTVGDAGGWGLGMT